MNILDDSDYQFILDAIDSHSKVQGHGIQIAQKGLAIIQKLQTMAADTPKESDDGPDKKD